MIALTSIEDLNNWDETRRFLDSSRVRLRDVARSSDTLAATTTECRHCTLILAERFDPGWVMIDPEGREIVSRNGGGFNEWDVDSSLGERVRVHYRPALGLAVATAVSAGAWITIGLAVLTIGAGAIARRNSSVRESRRRTLH
jgi:hypothetical protein